MTATGKQTTDQSSDIFPTNPNGFLTAIEQGGNHPILKVSLPEFEVNITEQFPKPEADKILFAARSIESLHAGHVRRNGADYFTHHLLPVATLVSTEDPLVKTAAIMHDVVEDRLFQYMTEIMGLDPTLLAQPEVPDFGQFIHGEISSEVRALLSYAHHEMELIKTAICDIDVRFGNGDGRLAEIIGGLTKDPIELYGSEGTPKQFWKHHRNTAYYQRMLFSPERDALIKIKVADFVSNLGSSLAYFPGHLHTLKYAKRVQHGLDILQPPPNTPHLSTLHKILKEVTFDEEQGSSFRDGDLDWNLFSGMSA